MTVFDNIKRGLGSWAAQGLIGHALALLVYGRLGRAGQAIARLMALFQAGLLRPRAPRAPAVRTEHADDVVRVVPPRVMPVKWAWLVGMAEWRAAVLGAQLQHVLQQPDMVALLRASPQARRVLGPVCRMLAVPPGVLRPRLEGEVAEVAAVAPVTAVKRLRTKRPPIDWGRIPLPRGVLTAARRAGFKPVR